MKLYPIISIIFGLLFTFSVSTYGNDAPENEKTDSSHPKQSLTLKEAAALAHKEAQKWNKDAKLYIGLSVDKDESQTGLDGKRKYWNIQFGIPGKRDWYLVTIQNGKVGETAHVPDELDAMSESYFISNVEDIQYDTPELLTKAQKLAEIYPGDIFAKGFNFGFTKDPHKNIPLVLVIGWDKSRKNMIYLSFHAKTGKLENRLVREQYRN
ncbi:hypothetical protein [Ornithinibacillus halotolerans]|uniref:Uncharacterized protein n=1 Tax=Ornithinibacillus halotolerans TaxID=1274357 RepID=A0A916SBT4_9BACI|nr:hypothetical protein [Ornithinibacillus halotolerans]GGA90119.1 hypothetical protein GCM10008025_35890 [Ornithinibacillus halotolerans]